MCDEDGSEMMSILFVFYIKFRDKGMHLCFGSKNAIYTTWKENYTCMVVVLAWLYLACLHKVEDKINAMPYQPTRCICMDSFVLVKFLVMCKHNYTIV
jgi:hypothetical protein